MNCPNCNYEFSGVVDSRFNGNRKRRRRECISCGFRYTTMEMLADDLTKLENELSISVKKLEKIRKEVDL